MASSTTLSLKDNVALPSELPPLTVMDGRLSIGLTLWGARAARIFILLLADVAALLAAALLAYVLWAWPVRHQPLAAYGELFPLLFLFPLGYAGAGLYPGFGLGVPETLRRISYCTSFAFLLLAATSFVMQLSHSHSRITFLLAWGASLVAVPFFRLLTLYLARQWRWWGEPAVLVGNGQWIQTTIHALKQRLSLGYRPVAILSSDLRWHDRTLEGIPVLGGPAWAPRLVERGIKIALVGTGQKGEVPPIQLQQHFRHVVVVGEYGELPVEQAQVRNLGGILGIEFTNNLLRWQNRLIKRTLDFTLGSLLLLCSAPLIILGVCMVKRSSGGPLFFSQEREGLDGRPFKVWKLRTMYQDAEQRLAEHLTVNPALRHEWQQRCKMTHDPRVLPGIGQFLRRWSIDELPQLWNVIKGEMSLVGPRPFPEYHLQHFPPEFRALRQKVRPGLTGMWQVMVRGDGTIEEQRTHDTDYIRNWSIWLDLYILARTIVAVVEGRGAF